MKHDTGNLPDIIQGYIAAGLGYIAQYDLMNVGAAILLAARLIVDIPPAIDAIKKYLKGKKK